MNAKPAEDPGAPAATRVAPAVRLSARERLLAAADELFYANGINTVGIDRVIEHAGVAKASLYDSFGSKEELIRAYLQARSTARQARINERIARYETPADRILSVFDLLAEVVAEPGYRGCAFVRAEADANSSEVVKGVCRQSRGFVRERLKELARDGGAADPELLAGQLVLLYDGAATAAYMDGNREAAKMARSLAAQMIAAAFPKTKRSDRRTR
jgi:AcrR family transcriptional regulator